MIQIAPYYQVYVFRPSLANFAASAFCLRAVSLCMAFIFLSSSFFSSRLFCSAALSCIVNPASHLFARAFFAPSPGPLSVVTGCVDKTTAGTVGMTGCSSRVGSMGIDGLWPRGGMRAGSSGRGGDGWVDEFGAGSVGRFRAAPNRISKGALREGSSIEGFLSETAVWKVFHSSFESFRNSCLGLSPANAPYMTRQATKPSWCGEQNSGQLTDTMWSHSAISW